MYKFNLFSDTLLLISIFAIILKVFNYRPIKKTKTKKIVPLGYKLFYSDIKPKLKKQNVIYCKLLFSEKYNLQGKPDYIYKKGNKYLPIELKSGKIRSEPFPHKGDMLQLIAYFLIIEDIYKKRPKYGKIIYSDYTFVIKNTYFLRNTLLKTVKNMRLMLKTGEGKPNCSFQHCKNCVCKLTVCEYYKDNH